MEFAFGTRLKHAWNAFTSRDPTYGLSAYGMGYYFELPMKESAQIS